MTPPPIFYNNKTEKKQHYKASQARKDMYARCECGKIVVNHSAPEVISCRKAGYQQKGETKGRIMTEKQINEMHPMKI